MAKYRNKSMRNRKKLKAKSNRRNFKAGAKVLKMNKPRTSSRGGHRL